MNTTKTSRKKRSPLKDAPLRYPGQSLNEAIQEIREDKVYPYLAVLVMLWSWFVYELSRYYFNSEPRPQAIGFISFVGSAFLIGRLWQLRNEVTRLKLGRDGEMAVGQYLDNLREARYQVFHDVRGDGFNIDHLLIGPAGIFTIETKTHSKPGTGKPIVDYDGVNVMVDGNVPDRNPIIQASAESTWLQKIILESTGKKLGVRPVVLYPGWFVQSRVKNPDVWVLEPKALPAFLENTKQTLSMEDVHLVSYHISRFIRETAKTRRK